ncbi:hypothetical protein [Bradyrhizobium liaoningense]|uniref:endonuclease/exonuclease/phosphatase family protein n=1 Tax=Bradyrhizobium liaoningense TaxID=43992 RepID=UPI0020127F4F|nr:hypothetical protein [Bradyrhizobium liaoningense]
MRQGLRRRDGGSDQSAELAALLPGYMPVFRPAIETVDRAGTLHRFGNMTLSRLPVVQINNHILPWPGAGTGRSMRRHALEVTVEAVFGPVRIVNTHLEYYSVAQREAQIARLLALQDAQEPPASTAIGAGALLGSGTRIEIEVVAFVPSR